MNRLLTRYFRISSSLVALLLPTTLEAAATPNQYIAWANQKFGVVVTASSAQRSTTWGEDADPDRDGLRNLLEYAANTDPLKSNPLSDCYTHGMPAGAPGAQHQQILAWVRTDDPDLGVVAQASPDLRNWFPLDPAPYATNPTANPFVFGMETGAVLPGLRQMVFVDSTPTAAQPASFMRLILLHRGTIVSSPDLEPFSFTYQGSVRPVSLARSNTIVLSGFVGSISINIPAGVTLYVNGIAQTGSTATVKAGDTLWMQATAPGIAGVPRNYTLAIGGQSATWTFTTANVAAVPDHPGTDSGYTPVETGVSDTGAAQISIPIVVSPGTAGMQPKLSINYSSQGGNGPLGVGFSLSGLSTISRVGRTIAQDGVKGGVNFDANDRFALDGQRLIAINGADGADGTEYRLEFDPSSRIRSSGYHEAYGGPAHWYVETKSGLRMEFGTNGDAWITPNGRPLIYGWAIKSIYDSIGNNITFTYVNQGDSQPLVRKIAYGSQVQPYNPQEVVFEYEDRPDAKTLYSVGYPFRTSFRMKTIESRVNTNGVWKAVRRMAIQYRPSVRSGHSLIDSIQETAGTTALPPTQFRWNDDVIPTFTGFISSHPPSSQVNMSYAEVGDFDANGKAEILSIGDDGAATILTRNTTGYDVTRWTPPPGNTFDRAVLFAGDFNSDGRSDFLSRPPGDPSNFRVFFSNGNGTFTPFYVPNAVAWNSATVRLGDFNGDGRTDFIAHRSLGGANWRLFFSNGDGTFTVHERTYPTFRTDGTLLAGDFTGDGLTDVVTRRGTAVWYVYASDGQGNLTEKPFPFDPAYTGPGPSGAYTTGDFNGDGIYDVLYYQSGNLVAFLFDGLNGTTAVVSAVSTAYNWEPNFTGDFNGDGLTDTLGHRTNEMVRFICIGDGRFVARAEPNPIHWAQSFAQLGDFDGDGLTDMTSVWDSPQREFRQFESRSHQADLLTKVETGHGGYSNFAYKAMTDPAIHTKGPGRAYPCNDIAAAIYLVSSFTSRNGIDGDGFSAPPLAPVGENSVIYRYEGAWTCQNGRGFQGFTVTESTDLTSQIITRTEYEGVNPLIGSRVKHTEQRLVTAPVGRSALISGSDTTWNLAETTHPTGRKTYFVTEASSISKAYEVNQPAGSALVKTATRNGFSYDDYGNLLTSTTTTSGTEIFTETLTNTYADAPTPTKWHLGRLETSTVTKTGPNPAGAGTISLTRASSFTYHPTTGLLTQEVIEPSGGILRQQKDYTHDGFGNILTSTISTSGAASRTMTTTYTPDGRFVATTTNALNHTESKTYDPLLGNVLTQTGPNNLTTSWNYDAIGRPIQENRPDGTVTRSFYRCVTGSTVGAPPRAVHYVRVQSSGGAPKTVWYDLLDREIRADGIAFDGRTVSSHKVFNNRGEVTHASQPYFAGDTPLYSQMLYDAVGREYQQTDPGNRVSKTTYDGLTTTVERNYNPAALTDFQKAVTVVNAMGWTVQSSQYLGTAAKTITRKYDPYGNLRFVTDPANNTTELRYDVRGNKTYMSEPNSGTSTFTYNGFGELKTQTNNANQTVSLTSDKLGRVLTRTDQEQSGNVLTTFEYDSAAQGIGQLARESSGDFVRSYFYDHLSRPVSTVESRGFHSFAVSRSYDGYGRPDAMTYPTGLATRQVYTANGHLSEVQNAATTQLYWRALAVNARGQITQEVQGNGVVTDRVFDANSGLIDGITSTLNAAGDVQKAEFDFDLIGNLTARRDKRYSTPFSETFGYDTLNRLKTVTTTGAAAVTAVYNDLGNITSRTDVGSFSYDAASTGPHALTGVTGGAFNKSCGYDAKGNRTTDGATSLTYSSFNKPVRMVKGGDTLRFDYGPDRALYRQTTFLTQSGGATSQTVREYIGGLYERETTSEGLVRHIHYIAGGSGVTAILTDERSASTTAQRTRYIHKDHLGSVDVITDSAGAVVERQSFDAWGRRRTVAYNSGTSSWSVTYPATPGSAETHRGFTGHEMLDAVGLVHMGGRIYDPITARFLSPDPFVQSPDNLQNLNRYSYVLNNPLSFTDPSGFFFKSIGKFIGKHWKTIAAVAVGVVTGGAALWAAGFANGIIAGSTAMLTGGLSIGGAALGGAAAGFGSAFSGTLLAGGSVGDALRAGLRGGAFGAASGAAFAGIDRIAPSWLKTAPGENESWFTGERLAGQAKRIGLRAGVSGGVSALQGGDFGQSAIFSAGMDTLTMSHEMFVESRYRWEAQHGILNQTGGFDQDMLRNMESQAFKPGRAGKYWKAGQGMSVAWPDVTNFGTPSSSLVRGFAEEGGALGTFMNRIPGMNQLSIGHDFFATTFEFANNGRILQNVGVSLNWASMPVYGAYTYGRWGTEASRRMGMSNR